jgi:hypothetical protein
MGMGYIYTLVGGDTIDTATGVVFQGVQMRNETTGHIWSIESRSLKESMIAIRIPSGKVWSGLGRPFRYVPPEIIVIKLDPKSKEATPVMHIPVGRSSKSSQI